MDLLTLIEQFISQWWTIALATLIIFSIYSWGIAPFRVLKNAFDDKVPGPRALPFIGNMLDAVNIKVRCNCKSTSTTKDMGTCLACTCWAAYLLW